jgi:hypothetical protein
MQKFLSGNPKVVIESPALDESVQVIQHFKVRFFSQGELKTLSEDEDGIEHLVFHLVPGKAESLLRQRDELRGLDADLASMVQGLVRLQEQVAEAEQAFQRTADARRVMERFAQAGTAALQPAQQDAARTAGFTGEVERCLSAVRDLVAEVSSLELPAVPEGGAEGGARNLIGGKHHSRNRTRIPDALADTFHEQDLCASFRCGSL